MSTVLVTGAGGGLGSNVVRAALRDACVFSSNPMRSWPGLVLVFAVACGSGTDAPPVDAAVDATLDALSAAECPPCDPDEICVHRFDGVCSSAGPVCVPTALACPEDSCSTECEQALCGAGPYQCQTRPACGSEAPGAFTCYGS